MLGESGLETHSSRKFPDIPDIAIDYVKNLNEQKFHYTTRMYEHLKSFESPITLIATGPLTNIALLLINHPDCVKYIDKLVLMGGAVGK